jgi:putative flippase GtrA
VTQTASPLAETDDLVTTTPVGPREAAFWRLTGVLLVRTPAPASLHAKLEAMVLGGHLPRVGRYIAGSLISGVLSTATFYILFATGALGSRSASLVASGVGAVASYFLNRSWAWGRKGRAHWRREMLPYWITIVVTSVFVALLTGAANAIVRAITDDHAIRAVTNTIAFVGAYALSFVVKYWVFDKVFRTKHEIRLDRGSVSPPTSPSTSARARAR